MTRQLFITAILLFFFAACNKDETDPGNDNPPDDLPRYLLKSIEWDNGLKGLSHYNSDSTVSYIAFSILNTGGQHVYNWSNKKLTELYDDRSMYTHKYVYDDKGRLTAINAVSRQGQPNLTYTLEYFYDNNNRLQTLRYYDVNEAGKHLMETNSYHYDANGYLEKLVTQSGQNTITRRIDAYSDRVSFDFAHYISPSLSEHYALYNYPVLSRLDRLPAKVTKLLKTVSGTETVEQITETFYTIADQRISKTVTRLTFPDHPNLNQEHEAVYAYY